MKKREEHLGFIVLKFWDREVHEFHILVLGRS